ncbi:succinate dehydrogenase/fumarate reductase flavoprotein subunit [Sinomonas atrocyanea]|uniref:FAD-dependent oxidoreductase n=1 Tax=Sinomonas atrocyanea TaxID=37927 RepID=UPI002784487D|nr:FAD-dependent oxidoreductase [Sinomonas atrocyanea]MDP9885309.1 succinate dehydrogenase/fumarate reductase flavoprotein subunit [Sinomonas atrocyanea]
MKYLTGRPQAAYDVVVLGSGAGALTAAATAARAGKSVVVLEKASLLGGTSAVSGGMLWIAANHHAREAGFEDSTDTALDYVRAVSRGRGREELLAAAVTHGDTMLSFVERELGVRFLYLDNFPDYRQDLPGSVDGGRTIEPQLANIVELLGDLGEHVRSDGRAPFTMQEYEDWGAFTRFPWDELGARAESGLVAKGRALVAMLLAAAVREGAHVAVEARGERLLRDDGPAHDAGRVTGVVLATGEEIAAREAVVIGTGGFEWDRSLADSMLASRLYTMCSPPTNEGDGLRMAQRIGAQTRGTREAWWAPMSITGDTRDGKPIGTLLRFERQGPGSIMVNRHGKRFANESQNYNDLARCLQSWDSPNNTTLNTPAYVVFDEAYLERYGILSHRAGEPTPQYLAEGATLAELAGTIGVPAGNLVATVERFNAFASKGEDPDFHRGETAYDRYWGDGGNTWPNPSLAPLERGPFYAMEVVNGAFGTNGGIATDGSARVLDVDGAPIPGLYAVGNATESAYAAGYPGAGATLGPLMTMGYLAGRTIAGQPAAYEAALAGAEAAR